MRLQTVSAPLLALSAAVCLSQQPANAPKPRVLLVADAETNITKQGSGIGAAPSGIAVGAGQSSQTVSQHSELWETARRFLQDCPDVTVTTDTTAPYDYAVRLDYQKVMGPLFSPIALYQLAVLNPSQEPLYVHKKDYLRREIKPACKAILTNWSARNATK